MPTTRRRIDDVLLLGLVLVACTVCVGCARRLDFVAVDASTGAPLQDVVVRGASGLMVPVPAVTPLVALGRTDAEGKWRTPPLGRVDVHHYEFEKAGYRGVTVEHSYDEGEAHVWVHGEEASTDRPSQSTSGPIRVAMPRAAAGAGSGSTR